MTSKSIFKKGSIITAIVIIALLAATATYFFTNDKYHINTYIPKEEQDSLLVNIVTYMGVKPRNTNWETRHETQHRDFYIRQSKDFKIHKYFVAEDGFHYFYIIRPARHPLGNRRAIGGRFKVDDQYQLLAYEELFVTQVLEEDYLKEISKGLFEAMIQNNLDEHLNNRMIIEWPDDRLKYDREKKEWRYDVK